MSIAIPAACLPTPPGCTAFPALGKYPESWVLHLVVVDGGVQDHRAVRGTNAAALNEYAAAQDEGAVIYAWCDTARAERCPTCQRSTSPTAILPCQCREAA